MQEKRLSVSPQYGGIVVIDSSMNKDINVQMQIKYKTGNATGNRYHPRANEVKAKKGKRINK